MMERAYIRRLDFATEWQCRDGEASFLGYSVFNVSRRGKYQSNTTGTQDSLLDLIKSATPKWNPAITEKQKSVLEKLIAPFYSGPLGIDMLVTGSEPSTLAWRSTCAIRWAWPTSKEAYNENRHNRKR